MKRFAIFAAILGIFATAAFGQSDSTTRPRVSAPPTIKGDTQTPTTTNRKPPVLLGDQKKAQTPAPSSAPAAIDDSDEEIKVETNLVTMPVSVLDREGRFVSGLQQRDFQIFENGTAQKIEYFQSVEQPFTVVLMIDVSPSTEFQLDEIQDAAITFVNQLRPNDRVMVLEFDERVRILSEPTSNKNQLRNAIRMTQFGDGTSLYEAVDYTLNTLLKRIEGRKAVVLFTDGVDTTSRRANYQTSVQDAQEDETLIYPIRYNTQKDNYGAWGTGGGTGGNSPKQRQPRSLGDILEDILGQPSQGGGGGGGMASSQEYEVGRRYLEALAVGSGGRKFEADSTYNLDAAFAGIAEELRRQYSIGYYPDAVGQKGDRKQIKIRVMKPNLVVRAKTSYIVGETDRRLAGK